MWLGFHKDMADPKNDDPVLRQSTRLTCMFVFEGQTSYDPRFIRKLFPDKEIYKIGALQKLFDSQSASTLDDLPADKYKLPEECSPLHHVTNEALPVLLWYGNAIDADSKCSRRRDSSSSVRQGAERKDGMLPEDTSKSWQGTAFGRWHADEDDRLLREHFGIKK